MTGTAGGSSRLDKLIRLIDTGNDSATREGAAKQVAGIAKGHPQQLPAIVRRVAELLASKSWETRVAASHCLSLLCQHFMHHSVSDLQAAHHKQQAHGMAVHEPPDAQHAQRTQQAQQHGQGLLLPLHCFSAERALRHGRTLAGATDQSLVNWSWGTSAEQCLHLQLERVGLAPPPVTPRGGAARNGFSGLGPIISAAEDDLDVDDMLVQAPSLTCKDVALAAAELEANAKGLSARQRNQLKRKAKQMARKGSMGTPTLGSLGNTPTLDTADSDAPSRAASLASAVGHVEFPAEYCLTEANDGEEWEVVMNGRWPFQRLHLRLCLDLLHPCWEIRHGAALGLRENLTHQAGAAGVWAPVHPHPTGWCCPNIASRRQLLPVSSQVVATAQGANAAWLEDVALRVLCLLGLDRFADFVGDQVVAPVRETAAQVLGVASVPLSAERTCYIMQQVVSLWQSDNWQTRMSALMSAKYLVAANEELAESLAEQLLPTALKGLEDMQEDVQSVAAQSLLPLVPVLHKGEPRVLQRLSSKLWSMLLEVEDLSAATASVMELLSALYQGSAAAALASADGDVVQHLPKLWSSTTHTLSSVRLAAGKCLLALLQIIPDGSLNLELVLHTLYALLQLLVIEPHAEVLHSVQKCWTTVVHKAGSLVQDLPSATATAMWQLAVVPDRSQIPRSLLRVYSSTLQGDRALYSPPADSGSLAWANLEMAHELDVEGDAAAAQDAADSSMSVRLRVASAMGQLLAMAASGLTGAAAGAQDGPGSEKGPLQGPVPALWQALDQVLQPQAETGSANGTALLVAALALESTIRNMQESQHQSPLVAAMLERACSILCQPPQQLQEASGQRRALCAAIAALQGPVDHAAAGPGELQLAKHLLSQQNDLKAPGLEALAAAAAAVEAAEGRLRTRFMASLACCLVRGQTYPAKLSLLIQPLMTALGQETEASLRQFLAVNLSQLVQDCRMRKPSPNNKIIRNLCAMVCADITSPAAVKQEPGSIPSQPAASSQTARSPRGAECALRGLATQAGENLLQDLPQLWELMIAALWPTAPQGILPSAAQPPPSDVSALLCGLRITQVVSPAVHPHVCQSLRCVLPALCGCARHPEQPVRLAAASCAAALMAAHHEELLPPLLEYIVPMLDEGDTGARAGAMSMVSAIVNSLGLDLAAYCILLLVPVLRRMTDNMEPIRLAAAQAFARIVQLLPLAHGMGPPAALSEQQLSSWQQERTFLEQLVDNRSASAYQLPVRLSVQPRPYQEEGINWLAFLKRSGLHGILADDMGIGKTLQATAIIAASLEEQRQQGAAAGPAGPATGPKAAPTLIVCPPTLVSHWGHEIDKYLPGNVLRVLEFHGAQERLQLQTQLRLSAVDVVVMSYEILRGEVEWLSGVQWDYCVLDEGHMIKNAKSKIAQACKKIQARHRLLLSGTPLQNNILELWSLFDFLMPGFLGTEKQFNATYGKTLQEARKNAGKRQSKAAQSGLLALEGLHKTVMPFILRRTKEQVLKDLPPKIIQDVYCDLSELQQRLYEDFTKTEGCQSAASALQGADGAGPGSSNLTDGGLGAKPHIFTTLKYMRALCSHPLLVLDQTVPEHHAALAAALYGREAVEPSFRLDAGQWAAAMQSAAALQHSAKLVVLRELLQECGIGTGEDNEDDDAVGPAHRVLIFAQLKSFLDIVEQTVLLPMGVPFVRLDGSVDGRHRFQVVQQFNSDPTIDVMLLTTHVGGLGLNLTSADVVIFLEHDWNPTKDLQAMDRAHRLGQSRTVNVYRILTRGTIEERILGLQRFKLDVASAVVNTDNMSMDNMDTSQLLEMFQGPGQVKAPQSASEGTKGGRVSMKAAVDTLGELWAESQYEEQFDAAAFAKRLKKA